MLQYKKESSFMARIAVWQMYQFTYAICNRLISLVFASCDTCCGAAAVTQLPCRLVAVHGRLPAVHFFLCALSVSKAAGVKET